MPLSTSHMGNLQFSTTINCWPLPLKAANQGGDATYSHSTAQHSNAFKTQLRRSAHMAAQHMQLRCLCYHVASFTGGESFIVCNVAHQLALADVVEAVADSHTLLQAVGPLHGIPLQVPQFASNHRQYAAQIWLHRTQHIQYTIRRFSRFNRLLG